mmetsp:Transcript_72352/g.183040  ORF Transcript_72352/g.183040 Transcript_72352/m.183040 type:complete len:297 (-) Transcript_72352:14-904(-)
MSAPLGASVAAFPGAAALATPQESVQLGCELLGALGLAVQVAITGICAAVLFGVWLAETPRRPFVTWALDVSKQVVGAAYGKCYNILQAEVFAKALHLASGREDQCVWYLMGITTDCLVTTFLCWGANSLARPILARRWGIDIGDYDGEVPVLPTPTARKKLSGSSVCSTESSRSCGYIELAEPLCVPDRLRTWMTQLGIWLLIITAVRLLVSLGLFLSKDWLYIFYANVFNVLRLHTSTAKTIFAVLVFPAFGDTFQILIQDRFLKKPDSESALTTPSLCPPVPSPERRPAPITL